ncbi:MAG: hypothetical protein K0S33_1496 [Bacteroidetes bacterium]|jgi:hypothetical protein|nr:hypothetical protein [Bacteroidota bacterium]
MKKHFILAGLFIIIGWSFLPAQTKRIAHKSHSGNEEAFALAYENHLFGMDLHNEGLNEEAYEYGRKMELNHLPDTFIVVRNKLISSRKAALTRDSIFSKEHLIDSVQHLFKTPSYPASRSNTGESIKKNNSIIPFSGNDRPKPSASGIPAFYISLLALFSLFAGLFSWQYKQLHTPAR